MFRNLVKSNQKFIKHNLFSYFVIVINILSSIYAVRENLMVLGSELYGVWILVFNSLGILGLLNFGFSTVAIFKFIEYQKEGRLKTFFSVNAIVVFLQLLITIICFIGVLIGAPFIVDSKSKHLIFTDLLLIMLPGLLVNVVSSYFEAILYYNLKFIYHRNLLELLRLGVSNLLYVFGVYYFNDIRIMALIYTLVSFSSFGYTLYKFLGVQKVEIDYSEFKTKYVSDNLSNGLSFWILSFSSFIISQVDVFFISTIKKDLTLVTMYSQSFRLQEISLKFIKKITEIKGPKILALYKEGNRAAVVSIYTKLLKINLLLSSIACLGIIVLGKIVLEFWLDKTIIFDQTLIAVLSVLCITSSLHWVLWNFSNITEQQKRVRAISIIEILLNLVLSYVLIQRMGIIGLGIASMCSNSVTIIYIFQVFRRYGNSTR